MRFSIVLAIIVLAGFAVLFVQSTFGEHAPIVYGLVALLGLHLFFKNIVNG